jgi:hypothetical protein
VTVALLVAGCGVGEQEGVARDAVRAYVAQRGAYDADEVFCTGNPVLGGHRVDVTICSVRRRDGRCDWFRVEFLSEREGRVRLDRRDAGCTLPD